jgi:hypothetical protein
MHFLSINFGDDQCASSLFRIHAYRDQLARLGMILHCVEGNSFSNWSSLGDFDGVIVQKKLFGCGRVKDVRKRAKRLVYDIDDAIWHPTKQQHHWLTRIRNRLRLKAIVSAADLCLAANATIAEHISPWARRMEIFPMALDETLWRPAAKGEEDIIRIGWAGAPGNLGSLEALEPVIIDVQRSSPKVRLAVLSGARPNLSIPYDYTEWKPGIEPSVVASFDIGLLPLQRNPFAEGKSPIKGLQYLASGIPIVATPLAATCELLEKSGAVRFAHSHDEWKSHLLDLIGDRLLRHSMGAAGRVFFSAKHALSIQSRFLYNHLCESGSVHGHYSSLK